MVHCKDPTCQRTSRLAGYADDATVLIEGRTVEQAQLFRRTSGWAAQGFCLTLEKAEALSLTRKRTPTLPFLRRTLDIKMSFIEQIKVTSVSALSQLITKFWTLHP